MQSQNDNGRAVNGGWHRFARATIAELLSPHFIITAMVLVLWIWAIAGPLRALSGFTSELGTRVIQEGSIPDDVEIIKAQLRDDLTTVSALFTTLLGLVLGHYFGQRSEAKVAAGEREQRERVVQNRDDIQVDALELIGELENELQLKDQALSEVADYLDGKEVPDDSALATVLRSSPDDGPADLDEQNTEEDADGDAIANDDSRSSDERPDHSTE